MRDFVCGRGTSVTLRRHAKVLLESCRSRGLLPFKLLLNSLLALFLTCFGEHLGILGYFRLNTGVLLWIEFPFRTLTRRVISHPLHAQREEASAGVCRHFQLLWLPAFIQLGFDVDVTGRIL